MNAGGENQAPEDLDALKSPSEARSMTAREMLETLRDQLAGIDTLCVTTGPLLRRLSRIDDKETALAIGHLWRLIEFIGREVRSSVEFADDAIAASLKQPRPLKEASPDASKAGVTIAPNGESRPAA